MKTIIYEVTPKDFNTIWENRYSHQYSKGMDIKIEFQEVDNGRINFSCIKITNLHYAMKRGKQCIVKTYFAPIGGRIRSTIERIMEKNNINFQGFMRGIEAFWAQEILPKTEHDVPSKEVFTPFHKPRLKQLGEKITAKDIIALVLNGKVERINREDYYSDDHAYDREVSRRKDEVDMLTWTKELFEEPKGWWFSKNKGDIIAHLYSFKTDRITLKEVK